MTAEFRPVDGFPYEVSDTGVVRNALTSKILKPTLHRGGYGYVHFRRRGRHHIVAIHKLVLEAFHGPRPPGLEGAHLDGNPGNNSATNLQWVTTKENARHRKLHGREFSIKTAGSLNAKAKIDEADAYEIRRRYSSGESSLALAQRYRLTRRSIQRIVDGTRWRHVTYPELPAQGEGGG